MSEGVVLNPTRLILAALIGLVILLVLIIKFNVQAMIAILIGAISIGLLAGMPNRPACRLRIHVRRDPGGLGRRTDDRRHDGKEIR